MAELGHNYNIQCIKLVHELKAMYPVVSDDIVKQCLKKHHNDKEKCIEELKEEVKNINLGRVQAARNRNKALLSHQMEQLLKLESTLRQDKECLHELRQEVCTLENVCSANALKSRGKLKFTLTDLEELKDEIKHLQNDCGGMSDKVTQLTSGRVLLGDVSISSNDILKPKQRANTAVSVPDQPNTPCDTTSGPCPSITNRSSSTSSDPTTASSNTTTSSGRADLEGGKWACETCTFHNHPALDCCEVCYMPRIEMDIGIVVLGLADLADLAGDDDLVPSA